MATMATNHVSVTMGQVATTSLSRYIQFFFPTTLFLVIITRCYFSLCITSGLYRQKTKPIAISQLHHHWKFYHLRSSAKIEINSNLMVQHSKNKCVVKCVIFTHYTRCQVCNWAKCLLTKHCQPLKIYWKFVNL